MIFGNWSCNWHLGQTIHGRRKKVETQFNTSSLILHGMCLSIWLRTGLKSQIFIQPKQIREHLQCRSISHRTWLTHPHRKSTLHMLLAQTLHLSTPPPCTLDLSETLFPHPFTEISPTPYVPLLPSTESSSNPPVPRLDPSTTDTSILPIGQFRKRKRKKKKKKKKKKGKTPPSVLFLLLLTFRSTFSLKTLMGTPSRIQPSRSWTLQSRRLQGISKSLCKHFISFFSFFLRPI